MRIAVVGAGISGLTCAYLLQHAHTVTLYDADVRLGGHAHTVTVDIDGSEIPVDVGFMVFNEKNYPLLCRLFDHLGVTSRPSEMSFSVRNDEAGVEWCGSSLRGLFATPRNLIRRRFWRMLIDVARFNIYGRRLLNSKDDNRTLEEFLNDHHFSRSFREWYLIPMGAAIWSADPTKFTDFPAAVFLRFFDNHGLLGGQRPQWRTVIGGSREYVHAIEERFRGTLMSDSTVVAISRHNQGVSVRTETEERNFDHVVLAVHSDDALKLLATHSPLEKAILGSMKYQTNSAVLHRDATLLPRTKVARSSWNWRHVARSHAATLTYDLARLQGLDVDPLLLTLNDDSSISPQKVMATFDFSHPIFDQSALQAQRRWHEISGNHQISYAGAYWGYGFHEDGIRSAIRVAGQLNVSFDDVIP